MQMRLGSSRRPMGLVLGAGLAVLGVMVAAPAAHAGDVLPPSPGTGGGTLTFTQDTVLNVTTIRFQGSINTTGLPVQATGNLVALSNGFVPFLGDVSIGSVAAVLATAYRLPSNTFPGLWVTPVATQFGTHLGPDTVLFGTNGSVFDLVFVPATYVSGAPINAGIQFAGTFATLNIQPGSYTATIPGNGPITYVFSTIPTPGAAAMLLAGGLVAARRRRR